MNVITARRRLVLVLSLLLLTFSSLSCGRFGFLRRLIPPFFKRRGDATKSSRSKVVESRRNTFSTAATTTTYAGLKNLANTCYMNSVLQSVFHAGSYREAVLNAVFQVDSVGEKMAKLFKQMCEGDASFPVDPRAIASALSLNVATQEDAQEFFLRLLHEIDDSSAASTPTAIAATPAAAAAARSTRTTTSTATTTATTTTTGGIEVKSGKSLDRRPSSAFLGLTEQLIQCTNVEFSKRRQQKFLDLTVDIVGFSDLEAALTHMFTTPDLLVGEDQYRAPSPFGLQDAEKRLFLRALPEVLCITLKRFRFDAETGGMKKIGDALEFPATLDTSSFFSSNDNTTDGKPVYALSSVVVHEGTAAFGHYTCYARPDPKAQPDRWMLFNDHMVSDVSYDDVCTASFGHANNHGNSWRDASKNAYLVFYVRQ